MDNASKNTKYQAIHDQLIKEIADEHWGFTKERWLFLDDFHDSRIKEDRLLSPIGRFDHVIATIKTSLSPITVFVYLNKIAPPPNYSSDFKGMHLALLVLFQLISGEAYNNMSEYTPKSSFYNLRAKFYTLLFQAFFQTRRPVLQLLGFFNGETHKLTKSVTLTSFVYDSRVAYVKGYEPKIPKSKETKIGVRALLCFDRNNFIHSVKSGEVACKGVDSKYLLDYDKDLILKIGIPKLISKQDRILVSNLLKPTIDNNSDLKELGYSYFTQKESKNDKVIMAQEAQKQLMRAANDNVCDFIKMFGRFDSQIFSQTKDFEKYGLELRLAALLFNVNKFVDLASIKEESWHSEWTKPDFGYRYMTRTPSPPEYYDIDKEIADTEEAEKAQEEILTNLMKELKTEVMEKILTNDSGIDSEADKQE